MKYLDWLSKKSSIKFLRKKYVSNKFIFLDRYSIVHFILGILLGILFRVIYPIKNDLFVVLGILLIWEIFEMFTSGIIFKRESKVDSIWDIIIGFLGFFIIRSILK